MMPLNGLKMIIMNSEQIFVKQLERYLNLELNDFDRKRIGEYLIEFRDSLPGKNVFMERLLPCSDSVLMKEGRDICEEFGVDFALFLKPKNKKSTNEITTVRRLFCERVKANYQCTNNKLIEFFRVNHATISFYTNGYSKKKTA
jgi:hypothetical protein